MAKKSQPKGEPSASERIDARVAELGGWRGERLAQLRAWIRAADPDVTEEWKWSGPAWCHDGLICTGEAYKDKLKLTFARGATLPDPEGLLNSSLGGKVRRALDVREGDALDERAFRALVRSAVAANAAAAR